MEGLFFNIDNGYIEGLVRGYRALLLTKSNYQNLTQCGTLEDVKMQLASMGVYTGFLSNVAPPISTSTIQEHAFNKLIEEFRYIRQQAVEPMATFLDYITYGYMIDNVCLIITGALHGRDVGELIEKRCHPLGKFDTIGALAVAGSDGDSIQQLYHTVLIDTPLAPYFKNCLTADELDDTNVEIIRNKLYKAYYEDFYEFCNTKLPSPSDEVMAKFIEFEADRRTINISLNAINADLKEDVRKQLLPTIGRFYPGAYNQLINTKDHDDLQKIIEVYGGDLSHALDGHRSVEDHLYKYEMELCKMAFTQQFTYSTVWAWIKSREQEVRNITWISECIAQNQHERIENYIAVYDEMN